MSTTQHTPGPWEHDGPPHNIIVWSSPENRICFLTSDGPTEANARLIAAAPDLLAALKEAADFVQPFNRAEDLLDKIEAVIAKAEGRS